MTDKLIHMPHPTDSIATPRHRSQFGKIKKPHKVYKPPNFDRALKRLEDTGELSLDDFNSAADVGLFIDWYNKLEEDSKEREAHNIRLAIAKTLANSLTRKHFILGK